MENILCSHRLLNKPIYGDDCHGGGKITRVQESRLCLPKIGDVMVLSEFTVEWSSGMVCTYPADMLNDEQGNLRVVG